MNKRRLMPLLALLLLLTACQPAAFDGTLVKTPDIFALNFQSFHSTDTHTFALSEGDRIQVEITRKAGDIAVTIQQDGDTPVYQGTTPSPSAFQVAITKGGTYRVTVTGTHARGSVSFHVLRAEDAGT